MATCPASAGADAVDRRDDERQPSRVPGRPGEGAGRVAQPVEVQRRPRGRRPPPRPGGPPACGSTRVWPALARRTRPPRARPGRGRPRSARRRRWRRARPTASTSAGTVRWRVDRHGGDRLDRRGRVEARRHRNASGLDGHRRLPVTRSPDRVRRRTVSRRPAAAWWFASPGRTRSPPMDGDVRRRGGRVGLRLHRPAAGARPGAGASSRRRTTAAARCTTARSPTTSRRWPRPRRTSSASRMVNVYGRVHAARRRRPTRSPSRASPSPSCSRSCARRIGAHEARGRARRQRHRLPFNSVMAVELNDNRTMNPMVNAGAIATTSLVPGRTPRRSGPTCIDGLSRLRRAPLELDEDVYASELANNLRNQGIAHLLDSYGRMGFDPDEATEVYTRQCSLRVTAEDLAVMGATLADGGVNPRTGERVIAARHCKRVLAVMATAGLYEHSGDWMYDVGLPGQERGERRDRHRVPRQGRPRHLLTPARRAGQQRPGPAAHPPPGRAARPQHLHLGRRAPPGRTDRDHGGRAAEGWVRHPADLARLVAALLGLGVVLGLTLANPELIQTLSRDLARLANRLPDPVEQVAAGVAQLAAVVGPDRPARRAWSSTACPGSRSRWPSPPWRPAGWRRSRSTGSTRARRRRRSPASMPPRGSPASPFPSPSYLAGLAAVITVLVPNLPRRGDGWRGGPWPRPPCSASCPPSPCPLQLAATILLGVAVGSLVLVALGAPARRARRQDVAATLDRAGLAVESIERTADGTGFVLAGDGTRSASHVDGGRPRCRRRRPLLPGHRCPAPSVGSTTTGPAGRRSGWSSTKPWRRSSPVGAHTNVPEVLVVAETEDGAGVLATRAATGPSLGRGRRRRARPTTLLATLWSEVVSLHRARIAHRRLHLGNLRLADGGAIVAHRPPARRSSTPTTPCWLPTWPSCWPPWPSASARRGRWPAPSGLGPTVLEAALPLLQPLALSSTTRRRLKQAPGDDADLLEQVRVEVQRVAGVDAYELAALQRITVGACGRPRRGGRPLLHRAGLRLELVLDRRRAAGGRLELRAGRPPDGRPGLPRRRHLADGRHHQRGCRSWRPRRGDARPVVPQPVHARQRRRDGTAAALPARSRAWSSRSRRGASGSPAWPAARCR